MHRAAQNRTNSGVNLHEVNIDNVVFVRVQSCRFAKPWVVRTTECQPQDKPWIPVACMLPHRVTVLGTDEKTRTLNPLEFPHTIEIG
jgi:hypothetical protein